MYACGPQNSEQAGPATCSFVAGACTHGRCKLVHSLHQLQPYCVHHGQARPSSRLHLGLGSSMTAILHRSDVKADNDTDIHSQSKAVTWSMTAMLHRSDVKADDDTDIHSQSKAVTRRQRRSQTPEKPELRLTRSMQPKETKSASAADKARPAGSLPAKLETNSSRDKNALNQGSSGSPGNGGSSSGLQRLHNGKTTREVSTGFARQACVLRYISPP